MKQGRLYKLGEICDFQGGSQPPKQEWIKTPKEGYVRMLQIRDFTQSRDFVIEYVKCSNKLRYCKEDDILIGRYGASVGKILTGLSGAYNVAIIKTIPNEQIISKPFIRRFFEGELFQALLQKVCGQRTAQAGFSKEDIVDCPIFVPPLSEQQRIVALLDAEFAKIDALKANAEKNLKNAKDLFQAALKKELEPKEGWKVCRIDEVCVVSPSKSEVKKRNLSDVDAVSFLPMEDMTIGIKNVYPMQLKTFGEVSGSYTYFEENDVLLAKVTPCFENGKLGIARGLKNEVGYGSSEFIVFRAVKESTLPDYLYYCLQEPLFLKEGKKRMVGACGLKRLPKDFVKAKPIGVPSISDQQSIVARLDALNEKCKTLQANYEKTLILCDDLKQSLLRKAFNGEI